MSRKLISLIFFVVVLGMASNASADLVAHWSLDDGGGAVATDFSGNGHDGTIGGTANWVPGNSGGALEFDGSTTYIDMDDEVVRGTWSLAMWLKPQDIPYTSADQDYYAVLHNDAWSAGSLHAHLRQSTSLWNPEINGGPNLSSTTVLQEAEWYHCVFTITDSAAQIYINGVLESESSTGNAGAFLGPLNFGSWNNSGRNYHGLMDDIRVYDHILSEVEILSAMEAKPWPFAFGPNPEDGSMLEATWVNMSWQPGQLAVSHDAYMSDNFDDVNNGAEGAFQGNLGSTSLIAGFAGFAVPDGLVPGTTYYWRVDEVNDADPNSPWKGDIWSFWVPPKKAYEAVPADEARFIPADVTLEWTGGFNAKLHTVYFGDSFDDVNNASGGAAQATTTFAPGTLEIDKTYYWRVDEFDPPATHKGDIWSFTTLPDVAITNPNLILWWTLDEGAGATAVDWSGHGNHGAITGDAQWTDGYQGTALDFGSDVYVEAAGFEGATGTSPRTCCAWIKTTTTGNHNIMSWGQNQTGQKWRMRVEGNGVLRVEVNGGYHYGVTNITDGLWHHVAVTFEDDGTPDVLDTLLYVDGQLDGTATSQSTAIDTAVGPARIGESPWHNAPFTDQIDDARIYDKVLTAEEIQQVMLGNTKLAGNPAPDSGAVVDIRDISSLSFSAGDAAVSHDVYLGNDRDAVAGADNNAPQFQGNQAGTSLSAAGLVEFGGGDYYWRVDEIEADGTVNAGTIWKFTVPDNLIVDDIESYNDLAEDDPASNRIYLAWIDGFGTTTNGAVVGNLDVPLTERGNVHGGFQAMPYLYDMGLVCFALDVTAVLLNDF